MLVMESGVTLRKSITFMRGCNTGISRHLHQRKKHFCKEYADDNSTFYLVHVIHQISITIGRLTKMFLCYHCPLFGSPH